jgi:hypothetical protein
LAGPGVTTLGITGGATAGPIVSNPRLQRIVDALFQTTDRLPGGTAGAVRYERLTGEMLSPSGHSIKAAQRITQLTKLLQQGQLSAEDRAVAEQLIRDLDNALNTQRRF